MISGRRHLAVASREAGFNLNRGDYPLAALHPHGCVSQGWPA